MLEAAVQSGGKGKRGRNHLCNRYCGGSHTVTTPQQRVTRMGHFLEQWGPEIAPLKETIIKGTDGHVRSTIKFGSDWFFYIFFFLFRLIAGMPILLLQS